MKVININKYIKTFSDNETGAVTGYAIVGNITELIKEIEENNENIINYKIPYEELKHRYSKVLSSNLDLRSKLRKLIEENAFKEVTFKINGKTAKAKANRVNEIINFIENRGII